MQCSFPRPVKNLQTGKTLYVPCGQCICCRINRTTEWTLRLLFEQEKYGCDSMFITLTYDNEHLPQNYSLVKKDFQDFMKRLRRDCDYDGIKIRYFACGEYGENPGQILPSGFGRPHYHAIIFGLNPDNDSHRSFISENWPFCASYLFDKKHKGIGTVTSDSLQYVAGYIRKKLMGTSKQTYSDNGLTPPFQLQSQGLGLEGFEKYMNEYDNPDYVSFNGHKMPIPRYFRDKLGIDTSKIVDDIKNTESDYLLKIGFTKEQIARLKISTIERNDGRDLVEDEYYNVIRPNLAQNHDNKIKQLSMRERKGL